ncbi:hypothetical protein C8035_v004860 [Colletotrichum spinosum]|uniref:Uncharacterized protein n=1 Tax=Colletotrichum spinosum TaxID=1347390 RepID=A0A4R8QM25_9PEZI|nr:hypothetical protein C8035_v004860 [Colletotrichum spinosum]
MSVSESPSSPVEASGSSSPDTSNEPEPQALEALMREPSLRGALDLAKTSKALETAFQARKLTILQKHIHPIAWKDAVSCVDRRLNSSKSARAAFDADLAAGTVADEANLAVWGLGDLCDISIVIDDLLEHVNEVGSRRDDQGVPAPGSRHNFDDWEASWVDDHVDTSAEALGPYSRFARDDGTEHPTMFEFAFKRRATVSRHGVVPEGVPLDETADSTYTNRALLQRALFRLELLRRAHYRRPLFPRGARWERRDAHFFNGEVVAPAGESYATRLARAEHLFRGWTRDDFVQITCAFKATLDCYAAPLDAMLLAFNRAVRAANHASDERRRVGDFYDGGLRKVELDRNLVALQWQSDPVTGEPVLPLFRARPRDHEFRALAGQLQAAEADLAGYVRARLVMLDRCDFSDLGCAIFRAEEVRQKRPTSRRADGAAVDKRDTLLYEAHPELEMSKFLHALCSLPLKFLQRFRRMGRRDQERFLKSAYQAIARVKASHAPSFLSGEMRAWSSRPAGAGGAGPRRRRDHEAEAEAEAEARVFPELSVRAAALTCLERVYAMDYTRSLGYFLRTSPGSRNRRWLWRWRNCDVTSLAWKRMRSDLRYEPFDVDAVFRMTAACWRGVWRSERRCERAVWTKTLLRWEGWSRGRRRDPGECCCILGQWCPLCLPLPGSDYPEADIMTDEDWDRAIRLDRLMRRRGVATMADDDDDDAVGGGESQGEEADEGSQGDEDGETESEVDGEQFYAGLIKQHSNDDGDDDDDDPMMQSQFLPGP